MRATATVKVGLAAAACLMLAGFAQSAGAGAGAVDSARLTAAGSDNQNWLITGRTYADQRFSPLKQIDANSVSRLGLAWHYEFDTDRGQEATPVEIDGVLYTTTTWSKVFAFDAKTGKLLWSFDPKVDRARGFWPRGPTPRTGS